MRLTGLLLLLFFVHVSAKSISQTITFSGRTVSLEKAFAVIRAQTGYFVTGNKQLLQQAHTVTLDVRGMPLPNFLDMLLKDQPLAWRMEAQTIFIVEKAPVVLPSDPFPLPPPPPTEISGRILDPNGSPISGATIIVRGSRKATMAGSDGTFRIKNVPDDAILEVSAVGFATITLKISNGTPMLIVPLPEARSRQGKPMLQTLTSGPISADMRESLHQLQTGTGTVVKSSTGSMVIKMVTHINELDETVIKGYYTTTKRFNTGSVTTVTSEEIGEQPVTNPLAALEGRVPGLLINQNNGVPGSNFSVQIRGQNSIFNGNAPLFIVDGVPFNSSSLGEISGNFTSVFGISFIGGNSSAAGSGGLSPLNSINPADIESIEVLKDADATAIYGSRGANGVILITTKKGKLGASTFSASVNRGINSLARLPEFMNTQEYLHYRREALNNDGLAPGPTDLDLNGTFDTTRYTDWAKQLIDHAGHNTTANVNISGGNDQTQFQVGMGYSRVSPTYDGPFRDVRPSLHFSLTNSSTDKRFRIQLNGSYSVDNNNLPGLDIASAVNMAPNGPSLHKPDGSLNWWSPSFANPYASLLNTYNGITKSVEANAVLSYQILPELSLRSSFGYTDMQLNETRLNPLTAVNPAVLNPSPTAFTGNNGAGSWIIEPQAEYKKRVSNGILNTLVGATFQTNSTSGQTLSATGFGSDALLTNMAAASKVVPSNNYTQYKYEAVFGRIGYAYKEKYVLNLTGRRDGSSRFAPGRQFGNFGAVAGAWIFGDERFVRDNVRFLSFGKLRASYGVTGSDQIGDYKYLNSYTPTSGYTYLGRTGLDPTQAYNPDYGWESNKKLDLAMELNFLKDRIQLTTDWYRNRSSNQLVNESLPPTAGFTSVQTNLAALVQNTGWEFSLVTTNIKTEQFSWTSALTLTIARNKLIAFPGLATSTYATIYVIGKPVSITPALFHMAGVNSQTGLYEYYDSKGQLTSSPSTATDKTIREVTNPPYYGGFKNTFKYKGFQLDVFTQFTKQKGQNMLLSPVFGLPFHDGTGSAGNIPTFFRGRIWEKPGDKATVEKLSTGNGTGTAISQLYVNAGQSDMSYSDASFIRIKTVAFSYDLKNGWLRPMHLKQARAFVQAQNLFTISHYLGYDPESQSAVLPPLRTIVFGLQLTF